jgi:HK97 family phage portal protein
VPTGLLASLSPGLLGALQASELPGSYSAIYRSQPSVYTVVEFLAWQVSQINLKVYRRRGDSDREHLAGSELEALIHDPAPGLTYARWMHRIVADLCIFGNNYLAKLEPPERIGERSCVPLPAEKVTPRGGSLVEADTYSLAIGNAEPRVFTSEEIIHPRRYNPDDLRIGISPLEPLRKVLASEAAAARYAETLWRKGARIDGLLLRPKDSGPWTEPQRTGFRESWRRFKMGGSMEGETPILEDGMTYERSEFSPKDAEFIEGRKLTLETVARAYNVPLAVLGLTETATYASQKEFHKALYQDTLGPWTRMIEDELQRGLVPWITDDPDVYVEFNIEEKMRGSFEEQAEAARSSVGVPTVSVNEQRARVNLPRIDDPAFDVPVRPANVLYAGEPGTAPMPDAEAEEASVVPIARAQGE